MILWQTSKTSTTKPPKPPKPPKPSKPSKPSKPPSNFNGVFHVIDVTIDGIETLPSFVNRYNIQHRL